MTGEDRIREIDEAIVAGRSAMSALEHVERNISGARGFGIWDMFGGGAISSFLKHSRMNDAQRSMELARVELQRFEKELSDINLDMYYDVSFDGLTKFLDIFTDNIFVDVLVQSQIREAQKRVGETKKQVEWALKKLEKMRYEGR